MARPAGSRRRLCSGSVTTLEDVLAELVGGAVDDGQKTR